MPQAARPATSIPVRGSRGQLPGVVGRMLRRGVPCGLGAVRASYRPSQTNGCPNWIDPQVQLASTDGAVSCSTRKENFEEPGLPAAPGLDSREVVGA
jgi:hypothetical protein